MDEELYRKLDEYGGKQMIFKMARDRTEDGSEVKSGAVIYDNNGRIITESKELLRIWPIMGGKLQRAAVRRRSSKLTRDPELG